MNHFYTAFAGLTLLTAAGCSADPSNGTEDVASSESGIVAGTANLTITSSNATSYCANVTFTNGLSESSSRWQVILDLKTSQITSKNGANLSANTGKSTATPATTTTIAAGASTSFTFCANAASTVRPTIVAWNVESNAYATCPTNSGIDPTRAALAVAMAKDLGRWDVKTDLTYALGTSWKVSLTAAGLARCTNGCANVKAILGQQDSGIRSFIDQNIFNPDVLKTTLSASFDRQSSLLADLKMNNPSAVPPAHQLTLVSGPTNLGVVGACGPHYIFQVDHTNGTPLTTTEAAAMVNALCFFGQGNCGQNRYLAFVQTAAGCPTGRTCVAIDPTDGDNSSTSTTTAGSAPTYPFNRVYDPTNALLGTQCITTAGKLGQLVSKCSSLPGTCGTLYCIAI